MNTSEANVGQIRTGRVHGCTVQNQVFLEMLPLEIMLKILNYAKMCSERQIIWTVPHLPHQKVGYNDWINIKPMS